MTILTRYSLRQVLAPTLLGSLVITVLLLGGALQQQVGEFYKDFPIAQFRLLDLLKIAAMLLPTLVGFVVPVAFMIGTLAAFNRSAQWNELTAMKAAGISLKRTMLPIILTGAVISVGAFFVTNAIQPRGYRMLKDLLVTELPERITLNTLPVGIVHEYGDWRIYVGGRSEDGTLENISIFVQGEDSDSATHYAKSASVITENGRVSLVMRDGQFYPLNASSRRIEGRFETSTIVTAQVIPTDVGFHYQSMNLSELMALEKPLMDERETSQSLTIIRDLRRIHREIAERLSFPIMCLAVSIVAAPLAVRTKKSGQSLAFTKGIIIIGGYFVLRKVVEDLWVPSLPAVILISQVPNILMATLGMFLIWRADRI